MKAANFQKIIYLICILFLLPGCATILSKSSYPLAVRTEPKGADVLITNKKGVEIFKGKSPALVRLKAGAGYFSKAEYHVKLSMSGYEEKIIPVYFKLNGWYFGNILIGGLLGLLIIDPATGAMWIIENKAGIDEKLVPAGAPTVMNGNPELKIIDIKDVPENMKAALQRIN